MYPLMTTIYHSFSSNSTHSEKLDSISPKLHAAVTKHGFESNLPVMNSILDMNCSKNLLTGLPENIGRLSRLIHLDFHQNRISSIPASIKGCCSLVEFYMGSFSHSLLQQNLDIWECLVRDWGTFSLGTLDLHSNQIHGRIIRRGLDGNLALFNALIDMYSKCGNIADSHQVFGGMSRRDLVFLDYHDDWVWDSWVWRRDEGLRYFKLMVGDYNISPDQEIYGCEVDLLGRAGKVEEAYELIESMPFKPDECVWGPFLGACKVHRFPNSRKLAAHRILDLRP
ncbi:putative pentatricopeptide repeat-containing protein [Vitis vinifera]|uniref:Putative pentatricopeptide repeat-containing protein n=1 Tax=Vitis vinifera TaxID=29760 RepID=A0A438H2D8_VITVI|nr:putative pentatricopeptide repeat-containing protein [Vitis vinifera]